MPTGEQSKKLGKRRSISRRRRRPLTDEQRTRHKSYKQNEQKLSAFLSQEKKVELRPSLFPGVAASMPFDFGQYADLVIRAFHNHVQNELIYRPDFDPKAEFGRFITSYLARFSITPTTQKKATKSRKGVGGREEEVLTKAVKGVLAEAKKSGKELDFETVVERAWTALHPTKPPAKAPAAYRTHRRDVRERLLRLAPHLSPKKGGGTKKRNG